MKKILFISLVTALLISINAEAKIWRVNNTAGVTADAKEKINAGASLVQVWTGFIYEGPGIVKNICKKIN